MWSPCELNIWKSENAAVVCPPECWHDNLKYHMPWPVYIRCTYLIPRKTVLKTPERDCDGEVPGQLLPTIMKCAGPNPLTIL